MADVVLTGVIPVISSVLTEVGIKVIVPSLGEVAKAVVKALDRKLNGNVNNMSEEELSNILAKEIGKTLESNFKEELSGVKDEYISQLVKEEFNKAADKQSLQIKNIIKYYMEISKMDEKIDDTLLLECEQNDIVNIEIYFSRSLTEEELLEFMDLDRLTEAYDPEAIDFMNLDMGSDSIAIGFDCQEASRFEVARFALFIDKYLRGISSYLYVESITMM
ncbi:MAG TPA: hypothetical protein DC053_21420 [Lachnoclostridium sp.]|nr:hypothetical protein [Lachnoclostridium sp.]